MSSLALAMAAASLVAGLVVAFVVAALPAARRSSGVSTALVLAPFAAGAVVLVALALPQPFGDSCHCVGHGVHPHLCSVHPALAEPLWGVALAALLSWGVLVLLPAGRELFRAIRAERHARRLLKLVPQRLDGVEVRVVESDRAGAYTVGILRPVIVVDGPLWAHLDDSLRRAVVHHEAGHVRRRDPMTLAALRLAAALVPGPWAGRLVERWRADAESACDEHAALQVGDRTLVAEALLSVERLRGQATARFAMGMGSCALRQRVEALLEPPRRPQLANDLVVVALLALAVLAVTAAWPGDFIHHAVETLLGLLS